MTEDNLYFVCEKPCRLTDINLNLVKDQLFKRSAEVVSSSQSIKAAIRANWIKKITKTKFEKLKK